MDFGSQQAWGKIDFFDFSFRSHHEVLAPERHREHSIEDSVVTLNVGFRALTEIFSGKYRGAHTDSFFRKARARNVPVYLFDRRLWSLFFA